MKGIFSSWAYASIKLKCEHCELVECININVNNFLQFTWMSFTCYENILCIQMIKKVKDSNVMSMSCFLSVKL